MELTKKHWIIGGILLALCVAIVLFTLNMNEKNATLDSQVSVAEKEREQAEKEQKDRLKEAVGQAVPTMEEVNRLVSVTDNQMKYEEMILDEYGKELGAYVFHAYVAKTLPSTSDNALTKRVKEGLLHQNFQKDAYSSLVNPLVQDFQVAPPFASTSNGFKEIQEGLYAG